MAQPCQTVVIRDGAFAPSDLETLRCMLETMRARTPARHILERWDGLEPTAATSKTEFFDFGDVVLLQSQNEGVFGPSIRATWHAHDDDAAFAACLENDETVLACILSPRTTIFEDACVEHEPTCDL